MKKEILILAVLGAIPAFGQSAFDGTWRLNSQSVQVKGDEKLMLRNGTWSCETCDPKYTVKADGQEHPVSGSPYYDTVSVREANDHTVEITRKKGGKVVGASKLIASADGKVLTTQWRFVTESGQQGEGAYSSDRVGELPAGANQVSGTWHPAKIESASESVSTFTFKTTADGLSMNDPTGDSYTAKFDGKDYPYKGDPGTTSVSLKKIDASTIEETDKRNGRVITVARYTVEPDGKTMKITAEDKLQKMTSNWTAEKQ